MATTLTLEQMKLFVRDHFEDFVNKRNAAVIRKNMTPDFHDHDGPDGKTTDVAGDEQMMIGMYKVMPDLHLTIEDMIAEGDKVACRNIWRWTDPSGKRMQFMVLYSGGSRATRSRSGGPRSPRQRKEALGKPDKPRNRSRNSRVDSRIQGAFRRQRKNQRSMFRYAFGVTPKLSRNAFVKWLWLAKPRLFEISTIGVRSFLSMVRARLIRCACTKRQGDNPVATRSFCAKLWGRSPTMLANSLTQNPASIRSSMKR